MDSLRAIFSRIAALFGGRGLDASLDEELRAHIEMSVEEHMREGVTEAEARRVALRDFGGLTQVRETYRVQRGLPLLEQIRRDLSFGIFQLWKSPGFTLTAILTLALGIGANTTVFSMMNGLLLRPLPVPQSSSLAVLGFNNGTTAPAFSFSEPIFRGLERDHPGLTTVFAFNNQIFQVKSGSSTKNISGQYVSGTFFDALETRPLLGRTLNMHDDRKGGDPSGFAAVISEELWNNRFHRDPAILTQRMVIDSIPFTIAGVMPRSFVGADPLHRPQIFVPLADEEVVAGDRSLIKFGAGAWWLSVMGRLSPGVTLDQASTRISAATNAILHDSAPDQTWVNRMEGRHFNLFAESGSTGFTYIRLQFRKPLLAVFAMCGGILLLACLNLASLLMARGTARQRELATRMALGASRSRLIQQLLAEGLLLGIAGAAASLLLAPFVSHALASFLLGGHQDTYLDTSLDARVLAFAAAVAILATLLFALLPAVKATSRNLISRIKDGQHPMLAHERCITLPRIFLAAEVGLALVLVVGAGLVAISLARIYKDGVGFDPRGLQNITFNMEHAGLKDGALMSFYRDMSQRLASLPAVTGVSYSLVTPLGGTQWDGNFADTRGTSHDTFMNSVAPAYFSTMRIPLIAGREFTWNDTPDSGLKIILNQVAARLLFPDGDALGRSIRDDKGKEGVKVYEVVGIVGDAKYSEIRSAPPPTAYFPMPQENFQNSSSFTAVVRTAGLTATLSNAVRDITMQMAPKVPAPQVDSMEKIIDDSLGAERMMTMLAIFFALCALMVTAVGLYGVLAYATARRTVEFGIRMALGATRSDVAAMVVRQNLWAVTGGAAIGLAGALLATRALASFLYLTSAHDPWVIGASVLALIVTACAASLLPALRAARIEPMSAIRSE